MKATVNSGDLIDLEDCWIYIPNFAKFNLPILPEISDSKSATYGDEPTIGRSSPIKTYSHSDNRTINVKINLIVRKRADVEINLMISRALQSATYPRNFVNNSPYLPPPICQLKFGRLLGDNPLCVILKNYSVNYPVDVPWDVQTYIPWKFSIDTSWDAVYSNSDDPQKGLPGQERILQFGA